MTSTTSEIVTAGIPRDVLQKVLRTKLDIPELEIVDVDVFRPPECIGNNFGSFIRHLKVAYKSSPTSASTSTIRLFMKTKGDTEFHKVFEDSAQICKREYDFFTTILPELKEIARGGKVDFDAMLPKCFYADESTIIFENLEDKGYKMRPVQEGQDIDHVRLVIQALAQLHAASYALNKTLPAKLSLVDRFPILKEGIYSEANRAMFGDMLSKSSDALLDMVSHLGADNPAVSLNKRAAPHLFGMGQHAVRPEEPFNVICHGDPWSNNMLFQYDDEGKPSSVKLVDLQIARYAPGSTDLVYYIHTSMSIENQKKYLEEILHLYYDTFTSSIEDLGAGECDFTYDEFRRNFQERLPYGYVVGSMFIFPRNAPKAEAPDVEVLKNMSDMEDFMEEVKKKTSTKQMVENVMRDFLGLHNNTSKEVAEYLDKRGL